jgi:hypothetical protein
MSDFLIILLKLLLSFSSVHVLCFHSYYSVFISKDMYLDSLQHFATSYDWFIISSFYALWIWGSHSSEYQGLLGCDVVYFGRWLLMFGENCCLFRVEETDRHWEQLCLRIQWAFICPISHQSLMTEAEKVSKTLDTKSVRHIWSPEKTSLHTDIVKALEHVKFHFV